MRGLKIIPRQKRSKSCDPSKISSISNFVFRLSNTRSNFPSNIWYQNIWQDDLTFFLFVCGQFRTNIWFKFTFWRLNFPLTVKFHVKFDFYSKIWGFFWSCMGALRLPSPLDHSFSRQKKEIWKQNRLVSLLRLSDDTIQRRHRMNYCLRLLPKVIEGQSEQAS